MLPLEHANLIFLVGQGFPRRLQLAFQKFGGVLRLLLAHFQILVDEKIGQLAGHLLRQMRVSG